jgi:GTP-binding protein
MAKQTRQAVAEADVVIFVVDARAGVSAQDHDIAALPAQLGKPVLLAANKAEGMTRRALAEFYELGMGEPHPGVGGARPGHPQPAGRWRWSRWSFPTRGRG